MSPVNHTWSPQDKTNRDRDRHELENLILKDCSVRSIWTCVTPRERGGGEGERQTDRQTNRQRQRQRGRDDRETETQRQRQKDRVS